MKVRLTLVFLLSLGIVLESGLAFADGLEPEEFETPPSTLTAETPFYRGMDERQATFAKLFRLLADPSSSPEVIPSRRWTTLRAWAPSLSDREISEWIEKDLGDLREKRLLRAYAHCHSDWYECWLPPFEDLWGASLPSLLGRGILIPEASVQLEIARKEYGGRATDRSLILLDPVISTSSSKRVALGFAKDRDPGIASYVLTLRDLHHRHCEAERKRSHPMSCFLTNTEYADELEYPFFGEILADEVLEFERGGTRVQSGSRKGSLSISFQGETLELRARQEGEPCDEADFPANMDSKITQALLDQTWVCRQN